MSCQFAYGLQLKKKARQFMQTLPGKKMSKVYRYLRREAAIR
jgi:hypothetical protein